MKRYLVLGGVLAVTMFWSFTAVSCKSEKQRLKEAEEKIERDLQKSNEKAWKEWLKTERLIEKATGVTSNVTNERNYALYKFMCKYPNNKHIEGIHNSIENGETYEKWEEMIYELKKAEGWREE